MPYTLVIAEKPNAASKISAALADGKPKLIQKEDGVKYYEFTRNGTKHVVVPAVGHLYSLKDNSGKGWIYPVFDYVWKPTFEINKRAAFGEKYLRNIIELAKEADNFIVATDFDNEGSVIGYNILKFACGKKDGKRMKFSTLTKQDLVESYEGMMKHLDFPQVESGLARHELDFLWGVNVSRALTLSIKKGGKKLRFYLLTAGRVQTPMLYFLIKKEKEIRAFKSKPFWQVEAKILISDKFALPAMHIEDKFWDKKKAEDAFSSSNGKDAAVDSVEKKEYRQKVPIPLNLTSLQTEAYRFFGWSPKQAMNVAQRLYERGYISYPRTSSQKLPPQIGYNKILSEISKLKQYSKLCSKLLGLHDLKPNEGPKSDSAHPSIFPTAEPPPDVFKLPVQQRNLYDLIVRRFMAVFGEPALKESMKVKFDIGGEKFFGIGRRTLEKGWTEFYGRFSKSDEIILPEMKSGDKFKVPDLKRLDKETQPPPRYSQGSIIKEMDEHNIGTKTTRAQILQTLYDRGYIFGRSIEVTDVGMKVGSALAERVPEIVSEELTRSFEEDMEMIEKSKKKREDVIKEAKNILVRISDLFKKNEEKIGRDLEKAVIEMQNVKSILGPCPKCGGTLKKLFSPFTKKQFCGCSSYSFCAECGMSRKACKCKCEICGGLKGKCKDVWKEKVWHPKCQYGQPLPQGADIRADEKICEKCNSPIVQVYRSGKRPFKMCLDLNCETKKEWRKGKSELEKSGVKKIVEKGSGKGNSAAKNKRTGMEKKVPERIRKIADIYETARRKKIIRTRKGKK